MLRPSIYENIVECFARVIVVSRDESANTVSHSRPMNRKNRGPGRYPLDSTPGCTVMRGSAWDIPWDRDRWPLCGPQGPGQNLMT